MTDETIFATALEKRDPAERAAYLDSACAGDPQRRARVEGLLAALARADNFLERPAVAHDPEHTATRTFGEGDTTDTVADALAVLQLSPRAGALGRIGHYDVLEVLGRGGFGVVFRAFDDKLQRVVAVKVLSRQMAATSPARKRFTREARSSAQVRHENVVQVYEVEDEPLPYLVMEFIPGETLQQRLDHTGPLEVAETLRLGRQIAEGLAAAHATGLIHRDIKPANVLIESGPQERVKLTDFGLARAADDASISQSGIVAGTPMYMAPEQARGDALDHRADLFSLGSVLYTMLTGRPPFRASGTMAVLKRVCEEQPRPMGEIIPEVPEWLCRIVEKLHAKDPDDRFQSAREVADLLADCERQLQAHGTVEDTARIPAAPAPAAPVSVRSGRRRNWGAAAALLLLVSGAVVAGLFVANYGSGIVYLYLTNRSSVRVELWDWNVEELTVLKDGEPVATFTTTAKGEIVLLAPGHYQLRIVTRPGFQPVRVGYTRQGFGQTGTMTTGPLNGTYGLIVDRGSKTCVFVTTAKVAPPPPDTIALPSPPAPPLAAVPFDAAKAAEHQEAWAKYLGLKEVEFTDKKLGMKFRVIPPGDFQMGAKETEVNPDIAGAQQNQGPGWQHFVRSLKAEMPRHPVRITRPFAMGTTEVTVKQFRDFVKATDYKTVAEQSGGHGVKNGKLVWGKEYNWKNVGYEQADLAPVWNVGRDDAVEFCKWLSKEDGRTFRLPTEAEWEWACRAGTDTRTFWDGEKAVDAQAFAQVAIKVGRQPQPVGGLKPNAFGLHDTCGNVWEWCNDWFGETYYKDSPAADPTGPAEPQGGLGTRHRVQRGGGLDGTHHPLSSTARALTDRSVVGFRVVCEIAGAAKLPAPEPKKPPAPPNPHLAKLWGKVEELVVKRDAVKVRFDASLVSKIELLAAEAELTEARIDYAEAEENPEGCADLLEELVAFRQEERDLVAERVKLGKDAQTVLAAADARLATAKARLAKVRPPEAPPGAVVPFDAKKAEEHQRAWAKYLGVEAAFTNKLGMEMRVIPPGDFPMGSTAEEVREKLKQPNDGNAPIIKSLDSETPQHPVRITRPFAIGATEVTVAQFRQFVEDRKYQTTIEQEGGFGYKDGALVRDKSFNWDNVGYKQADLGPVWNVSWDDANEFCKWLGAKEGKTYRLPTEAEWEWACRAGTNTRTYWGTAGWGAHAWGPGKQTPGGHPQPVGQKSANAFGLRDMCGNVWEWCADWYSETYYAKAPAADPINTDGPAGGLQARHRVQRGGGVEGHAWALNSLFRTSRRYEQVGFRVVCEFPADARLPPPEPKAVAPEPRPKP